MKSRQSWSCSQALVSTEIPSFAQKIDSTMDAPPSSLDDLHLEDMVASLLTSEAERQSSSNGSPVNTKEDSQIIIGGALNNQTNPPHPDLATSPPSQSCCTQEAMKMTTTTMRVASPDAVIVSDAKCEEKPKLVRIEAHDDPHHPQTIQSKDDRPQCEELSAKARAKPNDEGDTIVLDDDIASDAAANIPAKFLASKELKSICDMTNLWTSEDLVDLGEKSLEAASPNSPLEFHSRSASDSPISSQNSQYSGSSLGYGSVPGTSQMSPIQFKDHEGPHHTHFDSGLGGGSSPYQDGLCKLWDGALNNKVCWDRREAERPMDDLGLQALAGLTLSETGLTGDTAPVLSSNAMKNILQLGLLENQMNAHASTIVLDQDTPLPLPMVQNKSMGGLLEANSRMRGDYKFSPSSNATMTMLNQDGCVNYPNVSGAGRDGRRMGIQAQLTNPTDDFSSGLEAGSTFLENLTALAKLSEMEEPHGLEFMIPPPEVGLPPLNPNGGNSFMGIGRRANRPYLDQQLINQRSSLSPPLSQSHFGGRHTPSNYFNDYLDPPRMSPNGALGSIGGRHSGTNSTPNQPVGHSKMMTVLSKFGQMGQGPAMFNSPHGFCLGINQEIIIADTYNHRIQVCDKYGNFLYYFGNPGKEEGCLWCPRKIAVFRNTGNFVICDRGGQRSRMQVFSARGQFIRQIVIRFIDIVAGLAINRHNQIVAVDSVTPTVFILSEFGDLIHFIECSRFMAEPSDIVIHGSDYYICDFKGHSVVVLSEDGNFIRRVGNEAVTRFPNGIDISDAGDILIGDSHGNQFHVAVYSNRGQLISEFQCPSVKVSRCCGLKITSEGYVVTLAKNNHHVLVLDTLCIN